MACYEGETLNNRIARGQLSTKKAVSIGTQIASGLAKVHSKNIVHRDIKPANIFVTRENQVKIVDFGLAKLTAGTQITKEGTTLGTVAYMSPEQTQGSDIDHRTDIWSLGVVLYEMLAGERPFQGDMELAVIYNIVNDAPVSIAQHRGDISPQLQQLISKALQKRPDDRHENMNAFLRELEQAAQPTAAKGATKTQDQDTPAITVLPFSNMSADPEQEYFCDGMAEEIINTLMTLKGMRVTARTSSFQFKGKHADVREIGKALSVDMVLEGSVRKAGSQLRITAQLINVSDGFHVWSQRYDRDLEDVFAIQDDISKAIVTALRVQLEIEEDAPLV
jgi:TolB-like protein